jgi:hypothetical protein
MAQLEANYLSLTIAGLEFVVWCISNDYQGNKQCFALGQTRTASMFNLFSAATLVYSATIPSDLSWMPGLLVCAAAAQRY